MTDSQSTRGLVFLMIIRISGTSLFYYSEVEYLSSRGRSHSLRPVKKASFIIFSNTNEMTADWTFFAFLQHSKASPSHLRCLRRPEADAEPSSCWTSGRTRAGLRTSKARSSGSKWGCRRERPSTRPWPTSSWGRAFLRRRPVKVLPRLRTWEGWQFLLWANGTYSLSKTL